MMDDAGSIAQEAALAAAVGILGAFGRIAMAADTKPMLRLATLIRIGGDTAGAVGCWLGLHALGFDGWAATAAAFAGGALGFAVLHDLLLRALTSQVRGRR